MFGQTVSSEERARARDQARMLAIGHVVSGSLVGLIGLVFLAHVGIGIAALTGVMPMDGGGAADRWIFGGIFLASGVMALVMCEGFALLSLYAASCFARSRHRTFLIAVQVLNLMHQPIGTILGVFGLVYLMKPEVKALFEEQAA
jgi:hypothetical protein